MSLVFCWYACFQSISVTKLRCGFARRYADWNGPYAGLPLAGVRGVLGLMCLQWQQSILQSAAQHCSHCQLPVCITIILPTRVRSPGFVLVSNMSTDVYRSYCRHEFSFHVSTSAASAKLRINVVDIPSACRDFSRLTVGGSALEPYLYCFYHKTALHTKLCS